MKIRSLPYTSDPQPFPGSPPKNLARHAARWAKALLKPCPECGRPSGQRCINQAPSHRASGVTFETKNPHPSRLR